MASLSLSDVQKRGLAQRGYRWVQTIKRLNKAGDALSGDDPSLYYAQVMGDLHLLALALEHLDACIHFLERGGEDLEGDSAFRLAWKPISDLRHAREHEEEYVAGQGKFANYTGPDWAKNGYFENFFIVWGTERINSIAFMGRSYNVRPAIAAALNLEQSLLTLSNRPIT